MSLASLQLPHDLSSAHLARRFVEQFVVEHALEDAAADLSLIATELVTNAIRYGTEPIILTLRVGEGEITIEVADGDPHVDNIKLRSLDQPVPGGRGLRIVESLADRWGTRSSHTGKSVWASRGTRDE